LVTTDKLDFGEGQPLGIGCEGQKSRLIFQAAGWLPLKYLRGPRLRLRRLGPEFFIFVGGFAVLDGGHANFQSGVT
jgi:hypothetical protein